MMMTPKQIVEDKGDITYEGTPCKREGHTLRYTKSRKCVLCDKDWTNKKRAEENDNLTYEGSPCSKGGHTLRYTIRGQCVQCQKDYEMDRRSTLEGKKSHSRSRLKRQYGITEYDWLKMYEEQGGKCLILSCTVTSHDRWWEQGPKGFCVDHCHKTGKIRGLLCAECNKGTGRIEKNIKLEHERIKHIYNFMS